MKFPSIEEMAKDVAEKAFDEYEYQGKTIRQWVEILKDYDDKRDTLQRVVERLEEQAEECRKYWQEFDDEDSFGGMNAYCDAVKIVKEEGGLNV